MARRPLWEKPVLNFDEEHDKHRSVTWLELFFDLFFVVTIAQLTHSLAAHPDWDGVFHFVALFIPVWWVWIGYTYYNERFESQGLENRVFTFALMIPVIGLAVFAHHGLDETFVGFAASYALARVIIAFLWLRGTLYVKEFRKVGFRFVSGFVAAIILVIAAIFTEGPLRYVLFGLALFIDVVIPLTTIRMHEALPRFSSSKLPERFGLFVIIVLGEMVVGVVSGFASMDESPTHLFIDAGLGVALGLGLWWVYFDFIARRPPKPGSVWAFAWGYLHMPLVMAIAAVGAGVANVLGEHGTLTDNVRQLIASCIAVTLIAMALLEMTLDRTEHEPTHPLWSPLLKVLGGVAALIIGWFTSINEHGSLTMVLFLCILVQMVYGAWVWFTQDLPEAELEAVEDRQEI